MKKEINKKTKKEKTTKTTTQKNSEHKKTSKSKKEDKVVVEKVTQEEEINYYKGEKKFNFVKTCTVFLVLLFIVSIIVVITKLYNDLNEQDSFHAVSLKTYKHISDKDEALKNAYDVISDVYNANDTLSPTNLNLNKLYETVTDDEDTKLLTYSRNVPVPVTMEEEPEKENEVKSTAFQIFEKLQSRYQILNKSLYNLCDMNPVNIVRQYHYDGYSIIGKYNPTVPSHMYGKRHTYFIPNFSNVNIYYYDGDGNIIEEDNNIKDIMCLASVYSYYHNPYNYNSVLRHCYYLFDNSYSYVASVSEIYYCSGCMHYEDKNVATGSDTGYDITYDKITKDHSEQLVPEKQIPYKAGTLIKMQTDELKVDSGSYEEYISDIFKGEKVTKNNYCPGHIDLNVYVTVLTLDASHGLFDIDNDFGNRGSNYNKYWHGWDKSMIAEARQLLYKDWEKEYGISISYIDFVKPLTQEEINYYLNRLDKDITPNRKKLIETALKSVGRIPYYYGGKTSRAGFSNNMFGSKVLADYKGRCLKGLDCSGWISWVFLTAFNKYIIKSEGTSKLASEGTKITRKELMPGDLIIRPGIDSHVMMFLEWAEDGKMKVIHENGSVNNVSIGVFDAYYPYYRRIINT